MSEQSRSALVNHPAFGSLWVERAHIETIDGREYVVGDVWDDSDAGLPNMPDDYRGSYMLMNFPLTCVRKWSEQ